MPKKLPVMDGPTDLPMNITVIESRARHHVELLVIAELDVEKIDRNRKKI